MFNAVCNWEGHSRRLLTMQFTTVVANQIAVRCFPFGGTGASITHRVIPDQPILVDQNLTQKRNGVRPVFILRHLTHHLLDSLHRHLRFLHYHTQHNTTRPHIGRIHEADYSLISIPIRSVIKNPKADPTITIDQTSLSCSSEELITTHSAAPYVMAQRLRKTVRNNFLLLTICPILEPAFLLPESMPLHGCRNLRRHPTRSMRLLRDPVHHCFR